MKEKSQGILQITHHSLLMKKRFLDPKQSVLRPPSSRPSPPGEGESFAALAANRRLDWSDGRRTIGRRRLLFPLLGERARVREVTRHNNSNKVVSFTAALAVLLAI